MRDQRGFVIRAVEHGQDALRYHIQIDALMAAVDGVGVACGGVAHGLFLAPARQNVVADIGDAIGAQRRLADAQDSSAHMLRHPAVDAVADDIVEGFSGRAKVGDALLAQLDVFQPQGADALIARRDRHTGEINADQARVGIGGGDWTEIAARGSVKLKHPGGGKNRRLKPEERATAAMRAGCGCGKGFEE